MKLNKLIAYCELMGKLVDSMIDEHIASWQTPIKSEKQKHLKKRDLFEKMLYEVNNRAYDELHSKKISKRNI